MEEKETFQVIETKISSTNREPAPLGIALPNEVPKAIDFKKWPIEVLRSSAVDSLINQNDDLMSRLSVQIRKNALIEQTNIQLKERIENSESKIENLNDQIIIYRKKDHLISERFEACEQEIRAKSEKIEFLTLKYTEYYNSSQETIESLEQQMNELQKQLQRLNKYRAKIKCISADLKESLRQTAHALNKEKALNTKLKTQVTHATEHIQHMNKTHQAQLDDINVAASTQTTEFRKKETVLSTQISELTDKLRHYDQTVDANVDLKNRLVCLQRSYDEKDAHHEKSLDSIQAQLAEQRQSAKQSALEVEKLTKQLSAALASNEQLTQTHMMASDQLESIRILWKDNQKEIEALKEQNESLQKLNKQLSLKLNEERTLKMKVKSQLDSEILKEPSQTNKTQPPVGRESLSNVDHLIYEIQSGFNREPHS